MKKFILSIFLIGLLANAGILSAKNIGVPSECEDVMLQVFYWDSYKTQTSTDSKYGRTKWIDLLKDTAAINANFDLVWFPPSAYGEGGNGNGGVGYTHKQLHKQDSDWGTKTKLNELIAALHAGNTKVLADIVINHRGTYTSWCNFYQDNFGAGYGSFQLTQKHICLGDECFTNSSSSCYGADTSERGASDTGSNFDGARDLDHTNEYVQNWAKAYVRWMLNEMKYDGFRYDMTLGFHGRYLSMYNEAAKPYLSVSELWDGIDRQLTHLQQTDSNTMIFDFPMKYQLKGIVEGSYGKLKNPTNSLRGRGCAKYAVTFVDNHDTFERGNAYGDNQFAGEGCDLSKATIKAHIMQAYAYILMLPGVPCVFWPHWQFYKDDINALIALRKKAGIHSESEVISETSGQYKYEAIVQGHRGKAVLRLGKNRSTEVPEGYYMAANGDHYTVFLENGAGIEETRVQPSAVKGEKFLKDGQLYIRVNDEIYTILGEKIQ